MLKVTLISDKPISSLSVAYQVFQLLIANGKYRHQRINVWYFIPFKSSSMFSFDLLSKETVLYDNLTKVSLVITEYSKDRKAVAYGCLGLLGVGLVFKYGPDVRHRFFAWINSQAIKLKQEKYEELRKELFAPLATLISHDPELQKENALRILEIGVGVGANLSHYPDGSQLVVIDSNPHFAKYYNENRTKYPNIKSESIITATGEDMYMVASGSVDVVVTTLVLCSVQDMAKVVSQIKRVLAPGGKYFFMEHIREWDCKNHGLRLFIQNILSVFLWQFLFDGCHVNRNPLPIIEAVGFSEVTAEQLYAPIPFAILNHCKPHLRGVATK